MASSVIGALRVTLGLDSAEFIRDTKKAEGRASQMGRKISGVATTMIKSFAAVSAGVVALNKLFGDLSDEARGLQNSARLAGESFESFQRSAFAAKSVGIEYEKLGDIFKDTRDKIGDFIATGGGEMADFFQNIAPKVGVTAEQFKKLGGRDALQLYYNSLKQAGVSQSEMVFYMESIADEATGLIPLLDQNGAAFDRLGAKAAIIDDDQLAKLQRYRDAQLEMANAAQRLTLALVDSGLPEAMADLAEKAGAAAEGFTGVTDAAGRTDAELAKTQGARAFGETLRGAIDAIQSFLDAGDRFSADFAAIMRRIYGTFADFHNTVEAAGAATVNAIIGLAKDSVAWVGRMVDGIRGAVIGRLGAVWDTVKARVDQVKGYFFGLYDAVVGHSYVPDMVDGIAAQMQRLDAVMVDPARKAAQSTAEAMRDMAGEVRQLLDRLFPEVRQLFDYRKDLALIDSAGLPDAQAAEARRRLGGELAGYGAGDKVAIRANPGSLVSDVGKSIDAIEKRLGLAADRTRVQTVRIAESFRVMAEKTVGALQNMVGAIKGGGFLNILGSVVDLVLQLGSVGLFGSKAASRINAPRGTGGSGDSVPGFASGGSFAFGGLGGVDRNLLSLNGTPIARVSRGEVAHIRPANDRAGGITNNYYTLPSDEFWAQVDGHSAGVVERASPALMDGGARVAMQRSVRLRARRLA